VIMLRGVYVIGSDISYACLAGRRCGCGAAIVHMDGPGIDA
jgi:hypothetical protein